jgi:MoaA/NifB/PqqE/SkfB family radical SAM enzyme
MKQIKTAISTFFRNASPKFLKNQKHLFPERYDRYWKSNKRQEWRSKVQEDDWTILSEEHSTIMLCITPLCNSRCNVCCTKNEDISHLSLEDIKFILSRIGKGKKICLLGGEPTMRDDIIDILNTIIESGNIPSVYTNGLKFSDPNYAKKLRKHVDRIHFSFDGFSEEVYERFRGRGSQLYEKLAALKNLENEGYEVFLSTMIAPEINGDELGKILDFVLANNHYIKGWSLSPVIPYGKFDIDIKEFWGTFDIFDNLSERNKYLNKDYFFEFRKLYSNLEKNLRMMKNKAEGFFYHTLFYIKRGELKPIVDLSTIKDLNKSLEDGKITKSLFKVLTRPKLFKLALKLLSYKNPEKEVLKKDVLSIRVDERRTLITFIEDMKFSTCSLLKNSKGEILKMPAS